MGAWLAVVAVAVITVGCGRSSPEDGSSDAESASRIAYGCESGATVHASYPSDTTAVVEYEGGTLRMTRAVSASGARYVGGGLEWWTKRSGPGPDGTLFRHDVDTGTTGEIVESCKRSTEASEGADTAQ